MNAMLITTFKRRKEQKHVVEQRALLVPLRNSGKLRWCHMSCSYDWLSFQKTGNYLVITRYLIDVYFSINQAERDSYQTAYL